MRIGAGQLSGRLQQSLPAVCVLHGDEPLHIEESRDALIRVASDRGFEERIGLSVEPGFDWATLTEHALARSLFASRRLLDLRLPSGRPGEAGSRAIGEVCERGDQDTLLLITCGRIEARNRQAKWIKAADSAGLVVEHPPVTAKHFPQWVAQRLARHEVRADREAIRWLVDLLEGNLLAAAQEINKLALLAGPGSVIDADTVRQALVDHSRFSVYQLVDTCLSGNAKKVLRMLANLRREGVEPVLVSWALGREIRTLAGIAGGLRGGQQKAALYKAYNIWTRRASLVDAALRRLGYDDLQGMVRQLACLDRQLKGRVAGDVWQTVEVMCLTLSGVPLPDARIKAMTGTC